MSPRLKLVLWAIIIAIILGLYFYQPRSHDSRRAQPEASEAAP